MNLKYRYAHIALAVVVAIGGCKKQQSETDDVKRTTAGKGSPFVRYSNRLEPSTILAVKGFSLLDGQGRAVISDADIAAYDWDTHTITLRPGLRQQLHEELGQLLIGGVGFTAVANGTACYDGMFKTSLSSFSSNSIVIDLYNSEALGDDQVQITLGYPTRDWFDGIDERSNSLAQSTLKSLGKLK